MSTTERPSDVAAPTPPAATSRPRRIPGDPGIWVFVLGDMAAFALMFGILVRLQAQHPGAYDAGQGDLYVGLGVTNTVLLLVSSLAVALGVRAARRPDPRPAVRLFAFAVVCGLVFAAVKVVEYAHLGSEGASAGQSDFVLYYLTFTGLHLLHVAIGLVVLGVLIRITRRPTIDARGVRLVETGASYWHMVDLLWVVLFPLLYLLG